MRKKVIVLGGSSGIGKAIAERFAKEGWLVIVSSSNLAATQKVVDGLEGAGHIAVSADVTSDEQIEDLKKLVKEKFTSFHVLINSVGMSKSVPVLDSDFSEWDRSLQVMLYGAVRACRSLIPLMEDGGRIIHVTSIHHERVAKG
ncbi:MAG: SDR family oxidoreductase, partial [Flavisolibacter sp.]|nr:SDR family oxidoreductase [Flavisolibacter sp.]